jgi:hypothetical protein
MESINSSNMTPKDILVKAAFTRLVPCDRMTMFGTEKIVSTESNPAYISEAPNRVVMTQADFLREHDINAHKINSMKYWPNAIMKDNEGKVAAKIRSRIAIAFQERILVKRLVTLTGNNVDLKLANSKRTRQDQELLNLFREGWDTHNIETCLYQAIKADGMTGDCAVNLFMSGGKVGWRVFSFNNGDVLYPHYDPMTGELAVFGRKYSIRDNKDEVEVDYLDVWDSNNYTRYKCVKKGVKGMVNKAKEALGIGNWEIDVAPTPHNFNRIPIAYDRYGEPFWANSQDAIDLYELTVSQLAENNQAYALRILYLLGGEMELQTNADGTPSIINSAEPNAKVGFLEPADSSKSFELQLQILEKSIMRNSFASETPELKSGSDLSSPTIRMMMMDSYQKAQDDALHFQPFLDDIVELFKYGYGIECSRSSDFNILNIRAEIFPYVFMSETEVVSNIVQSVGIGALSKRSASEMLYDLGYGVISEYDRLIEQNREELIATQPAVQGSSNNNIVGKAREAANIVQ